MPLSVEDASEGSCAGSYGLELVAVAFHIEVGFEIGVAIQSSTIYGRGEFDELWYRLYVAISRCNRALEALNAAAVTPANTQLKAEVRFLRAHFYYKLQQMWYEVPYIIEAAYKKGFPVVFNASPFDASLMEIDFSKISWLLVNEIEGGCITGETEPEAILKKMREKYPQTGVVLTLGKEGSICARGDTVIHQGIFPVSTVDTTAAGDTFTGYFIAGLDAGLTLEEALCRASAASAVAVTRPGAAPSIPLAEEVTAFLKERQ